MKNRRGGFIASSSTPHSPMPGKIENCKVLLPPSLKRIYQTRSINVFPLQITYYLNNSSMDICGKGYMQKKGYRRINQYKNTSKHKNIWGSLRKDRASKIQQGNQI